MSPMNSRVIRRLLQVVLDAALASVAVLVAVLFLTRGVTGGRILAAIVITVLTVVITNALAGSYNKIWHHFSFRDGLLLGATGISVTVVLFSLAAIDVARLPLVALQAIPMAYVVLAAGSRSARRLQVALRRRRKRMRSGLATGAQPHRVLIAGAGHCGLVLSRDLVLMSSPNVELVGFLDDDPAKIGAHVNGAPVLAPLSALREVVDRCEVSELMVAMPSAPEDVLRRLIQQAEDLSIRVRTLPGVERLLMGVDIHQPGRVTLSDLIDAEAFPTHRAASVDEAGGPVVLVTGGAGFIGSHVTKMLLARGYSVRVIDNFTYGDTGLARVRTHPGLELVEGDVCNIRDIQRCVRGVDGVIALAAIVGDPACDLDPQETLNLNYEATKLLIEACNFHGVRRLVFASSCSVYGASSEHLLTERSQLNPVSLYARTRILSENIIFDRCGAVEPVVLRLATAFGLSDRMRFDLVVNTLTARGVGDKRITIFGGDQWRPNVHCQDAARAFIMAYEAPGSQVAGEVFNVGGDDLNYRIAEIGSLVVDTLGDVEMTVDTRDVDARDYRVGFGKIRSVLGFEPEYTVKGGILEIADAIAVNPSLKAYDEPTYHNVRVLEQVLPDGNGRQPGWLGVEAQ